MNGEEVGSMRGLGPGPLWGRKLQDWRYRSGGVLERVAGVSNNNLGVCLIFINNCIGQKNEVRGSGVDERIGSRTFV